MKESLQITLRKNRRSEDLIQIARKQKGEKITHSYTQSNEAIPDEEIYSESEIFEIAWFDQAVKFFLEHMDSNATELERYRLFLPEKLYQALFELSQKCKKHGVDYRPMDSVLKSIINKIKVTEKKLFEKTGVEHDVLSKIGYKHISSDSDELNQSITKIFKTLTEQPDFYTKFNQVAEQQYKKSHNIKLGHFKGYAQGHNTPSKWVASCAIDVLSNSLNPLSIISEDVLLHVWIKPSLRSGKHKQEIINQLKKWGASPDFINNFKESAPLLTW